MSYTNRRVDLRDGALYSAFFAVAFAPLWLILSINCGIKEVCHWSITVAVVSIIIVLIFGMVYYIKKLHSSRKKTPFKVEKKDDITPSIAFYILAYIPALFVESFTLTELVAFVILLSIVYLVYIKANLLYVNPILTAIGYKTYRVTDDHSNTVVLLSRSSVIMDEDVDCVEIAPNIILVLDQEQ